LFLVIIEEMMRVRAHTTTNSISNDNSIRTMLLKAMLHEAIFLATCNATNVVWQVARKHLRATPYFATAIVALRVARKVERPSTLRNAARQVACV